MRLELRDARRLVFDDGAPVRAASALAPYRDGWLVAQDDGAHAAWVRAGRVERLRLLDPVQGHDVFGAGRKHLKPDLEAACAVDGGVLLLGSGSTPARTRTVLLDRDGGTTVAERAPLYVAVARALERSPEQLNLEGACRIGSALRWFARGVAGHPSASVDVALDRLLDGPVSQVGPVSEVGTVRWYDLGAVDGVGLDVTDAVALPDGRVLVSAAAEQTASAYDDGPVVASALALLDDERVVGSVRLPLLHGAVAKVEGLGLLGTGGDGARLLAVVDADDPAVASWELCLDVSWD